MTLSEALSIRIDELLSKYEITPYRLSQLSGVSQAISPIRRRTDTTI